MSKGRDLVSAGGLVLGIAVVAAAHVAGGGNLRMFVQPTAMLVVLGGTTAALLVSFPWRTSRRAVRAALAAFFRRPEPPSTLLPQFLALAHKARRQGVMSVEADIDDTRDPFLARALALAVSGLSPQLFRQMLEIDARTDADRDEELAEVFEAAAGYAPTLGIVGAVLGLMHVMQDLSSSGGIGAGIAAAFVATIYGVGMANLVFLPIATRLRVAARVEARRRELTIDGIVALHDRLHPSVLEDRLTGYLRDEASDARQVSAA